MAAFQDSVHDTSPGMCVQASALGLSVGVVLGAAAMQRYDYPVLLGLSVTLLLLMLVAPLTEVHAGSLAQLTAGFTMGSILVTGALTSPEVASTMIAIATPAYMCGMLGGVHAAISSPALLFPHAAGLASISVLAGSWGASHDPPMNPDLWLEGA